MLQEIIDFVCGSDVLVVSDIPSKTLVWVSLAIVGLCLCAFSKVLKFFITLPTRF